MIRYQPLGLVVAGLLSICFTVTSAAEEKKGDKKGKTIEGTIMKVDSSGHRLTVHVKATNKQKTPAQPEFSLGAATKFLFRDGEEEQEVNREQAYKHKQFKEGAPVTVITDDTGRVKEVRVGTPRKESEKR